MRHGGGGRDGVFVGGEGAKGGRRATGRRIESGWEERGGKEEEKEEEAQGGEGTEGGRPKEEGLANGWGVGMNDSLSWIAFKRWSTEVSTLRDRNSNMLRGRMPCQALPKTALTAEPVAAGHTPVEEEKSQRERRHHKEKDTGKRSCAGGWRPGTAPAVL